MTHLLHLDASARPGLAGKDILGAKVYASLAEIPEPLDMVESRVLPRTESGMSLPAISRIRGLSSKRSTCEGPPPCQRQIMRLAFGAKWGACGASGSMAAPRRASSARSSETSPGNRVDPPTRDRRNPRRPGLGRKRGFMDQSTCRNSLPPQTTRMTAAQAASLAARPSSSARRPR